jgi:hypothetical protein
MANIANRTDGMKTLRSFIISFSATGLVVAFVANLFWTSFGNQLPQSSDTILFKTTLMFFPAYLGTMDIGRSNNWSIVIFGFMIYNVAMYSILGGLTWLGVFKHKAFLLIEAIFLSALWYGIWVML